MLLKGATICGIALIIAAVITLMPRTSIEAEEAKAESARVAAIEKEEMKKRPAVGQKAPDFELKTLDGQLVKLTELSAKGPVVLVQLRGWVGYHCPVCTQQVGRLLAARDDIKATGASVVLLYPGPADELDTHARDFLKGTTFPEHFHFVLDPGMKFVNDYGLLWPEPNETAYPATFVLDKEGIVRWADISGSHAGRANVDTVLEALRGLQ